MVVLFWLDIISLQMFIDFLKFKAQNKEEFDEIEEEKEDFIKTDDISQRELDYDFSEPF